MKTFVIIPNITKDKELNNTKLMVNWLEKHNYRIHLQKNVAELIGKTQYSMPEKKCFSQADCAIVLGGDGTIINAARELAYYDLPILGVNLGNLGFLAEVEKKDAIETLENIANGHYFVQTRMMLDVWMKIKSREQNIGIALNDIVIARTSLSRMMKYSIYVNNEHVNDYSADGIIVSTPTGSTAYNLSAGGPILDPKNEMMVITPICPHSLSSRSIVLSKNDVVTITLEENRQSWNDDIMLTIDGQEGLKINNDTKIIISKSNHKTKLITCKKDDFYNILRKKLG